MTTLTFSILVVITCIIGAFIISPWFGLAILAIALIILVWGGLIHNAPDEEKLWPKDAEPVDNHIQWFNCANCDCSYFATGDPVRLHPKPVAPLGICGECERRIKQSISTKLETHFNGGKK